MLIKEVITVCKLIQVNPCTSATGGRSVLTARRLLTWNRSTMSQERCNSISTLNVHKEPTVNVCKVCSPCGVNLCFSLTSVHPCFLCTVEYLLYDDVKHER